MTCDIEEGIIQYLETKGNILGGLTEFVDSVEPSMSEGVKEMP